MHYYILVCRAGRQYRGIAVVGKSLITVNFCIAEDLNDDDLERASDCRATHSVSWLVLPWIEHRKTAVNKTLAVKIAHFLWVCGVAEGVFLAYPYPVRLRYFPARSLSVNSESLLRDSLRVSGVGRASVRVGWWKLLHATILHSRADN